MYTFAGSQVSEAPKDYGPHKTIYNRLTLQSRIAVFNRIFAALTAKGGKPDQLMIDATHIKAHRTAANLLKNGVVRRRIGRIRGGLNLKLHVVCNSLGRPLVMLLSEGQMSYYKSAALILEALPLAKTLHADLGHDADWFRNALVAKGIAPSIPCKTNRILPIPHDRLLYRQRHRIENMFGKLEDSSRIYPDMIDVPTTSCPPSTSLEPSPSGCDQ